MSHVRKMALVDPRLLETLRTPTQTPVDKTLRDLDAEMTSILDKGDVDISEKVRLYNRLCCATTTWSKVVRLNRRRLLW